MQNDTAVDVPKAVTALYKLRLKIALNRDNREDKNMDLILTRVRDEVLDSLRTEIDDEISFIKERMAKAAVE